jgi:hypothetical protein
LSHYKIRIVGNKSARDTELHLLKNHFRKKKVVQAAPLFVKESKLYFTTCGGAA